MPRRAMTADTRLSVALHAAAQRAVYAGTPIPTLVDELHSLAGDRPDILAQTAGLVAGAWSVKAPPRTHQRAIADALLALPGVDAGEVARGAALGRARALTPRYRAAAPAPRDHRPS